MSRLDDEREELMKYYRETVGEKIAALEKARAELESGGAGAHVEIKRLAHQIYGSGTSFGFPEVTELADRMRKAEPSEVPETLDALIELLQDVGRGGE